MGKRSVRDFPIEYFDIWSLAVAGGLHLTFPTKGMATNKKVDLQIFRKRLSEEDPTLARAFFQVDLLVQGDSHGGTLTGYVPDWKKQVREQLSASDLSPPVLAAIAATTEAKQDEAAQGAVASVLQDLGFKAPET